MLALLKAVLAISLIVQTTVSIPFPCSVYDAFLTVTQSDVVLDINYEYGNRILASTIGQAIDPTARSVDALSLLCTCSSLHASNVTIDPQQITTLRIVNQQINATHLTGRQFGCLTGLTTVDLSGNSFPNGFDDAVFSLQSALANLHLDNCKISNLYNSIFGNLPNLQTLTLRSNRFQTLPTDFLSGSQIGSLTLDDNLLLQSIPKKMILMNPSLKLSVFRTPSLSCVPGVRNLIPANSLANCSDIVPSDKIYSGSPVLTQKISVQFSSIWDYELTSNYLADFLDDITLALSLDSSRIINPEIRTDSGRTTVLFNVLPRTREGQLAAESVSKRIVEQLHTSRQFSTLKQGIVTQWLTAISKVESKDEELAFCKIFGVFTGVKSCNSAPENNRWFLWTSPIFLAAIASLSTVIVIILMLVLIQIVRKKQAQTKLTTNSATPREISNLKQELPLTRAVSAVPFTASDVQNVHMVQGRAQSAIPTLQFQAPSSAPMMDEKDQTDRHRSASVNKPKPRKKTKKWDADRLANPWIAKEENQSDDDDNEFW